MRDAAQPFAGVDAVLRSELGARALDRALRLGWIDRLERQPLAVRALPGAGEHSPAGLALLLGQLKAAGVVEGGESIALTPEFRRVLATRDLLEARLWFLLAIATDVHRHFGLLLEDPAAFVQQAEVFRIFDYSKALTTGVGDLAATDAWVRYTTALTRYEAPLLAPLLGLDGASRVLDVGGNSGEFALQLAATYPALNATVVDLPAVCALGTKHVAGKTGSERVSFAPRDLRSEALPGPVDAVVFKSVLHDWPDDMAAEFIGKAGGRFIPVAAC